ncbi:hypothetical protein JTE90_016639 [Oedothorax gibbosus]|uniref:Uncharacterized protein n=1 Tax=Oedothorax gibbosus TaxID=931172 RepID=A0AAV6U430_9ARAC|nr:hypothetical protein JTE90_016639 [Oedothorax gibbosus]
MRPSQQNFPTIATSCPPLPRSTPLFTLPRWQQFEPMSSPKATPTAPEATSPLGRLLLHTAHTFHLI